MSKILVNGTEIQVIKFEEDYISLTDMVRNIENGVVLIEKWLRNKNTIEFLGIWEELYNEQFDYDEYCSIMQEAGISQKDRLIKLNEIAIHQMVILEEQAEHLYLKLQI